MSVPPFLISRVTDANTAENYVRCCLRSWTPQAQALPWVRSAARQPHAPRHADARVAHTGTAGDLLLACIKAPTRRALLLEALNALAESDALSDVLLPRGARLRQPQLRRCSLAEGAVSDAVTGKSLSNVLTRLALDIVGRASEGTSSGTEQLVWLSVAASVCRTPISPPCRLRRPLQVRANAPVAALLPFIAAGMLAAGYSAAAAHGARAWLAGLVNVLDATARSQSVCAARVAACVAAAVCGACAWQRLHDPGVARSASLRRLLLAGYVVCVLFVVCLLTSLWQLCYACIRTGSSLSPAEEELLSNPLCTGGLLDPVQDPQLIDLASQQGEADSSIAPNVRFLFAPGE